MIEDMPREVIDQRTTRTGPHGHRLKPNQLWVPGLVILSHPDPSRIGETSVLPRLRSGQEVAVSRLEPTFAQPGIDADFRPLDDDYLSRQPLRLIPEGRGPQDRGITLDRSTTRTAVLCQGVEIVDRRTFSPEDIDNGVVLCLNRRVTLLLGWLDPVPPRTPRYDLVGESRSMLELRQEIRAAAALDVSVLLRGETGSGKELVARALHQASPRHRGPYLTVNMGALTPALAASELFGAERGAYTGADRRRTGFFRSAEGGTLFLDEIGEAPPEVQVMLLRVLENREIQPVGSVDSRPIDVRVIAATDAKLEDNIASGSFRAPLLHRLAGFEIQLPPLRRRRDDITRLLAYFLDQESQKLLGRPFARPGESSWPAADLVARLVEYSWPGNVRQLRNVARRLVIAQKDGLRSDAVVRLIQHLTPDPSPAAGVIPTTDPSDPAPMAAPEGFYKRYRRSADVSEEELIEVLTRHRFQLTPTATELGVSRPTLYRLIDSCSRIRKAIDLDPAEIEEALAHCGGDLSEAAHHLKVSPQGLKRRLRQLKTGE